MLKIVFTLQNIHFDFKLTPHEGVLSIARTSGVNV